jgi:hypothetical protein
MMRSPEGGGNACSGLTGIASGYCHSQAGGSGSGGGGGGGGGKGKIVHLSEHLLINDQDPRYPALKQLYKDTSGVHCLWLCSEVQIWATVCFNYEDICGSEFADEFHSWDPFADPFEQSGGILLGSGGVVRKLLDPASMRGASLDEVKALADEMGLKSEPMSPTAATGGEGTRFFDPEDKAVNIFWEKGDPDATSADPTHKGPYLKYQVRGQGKDGAVRVPGAGNPNPESGFTGKAPPEIAGWRVPSGIIEILEKDPIIIE